MSGLLKIMPAILAPCFGGFEYMRLMMSFT